jgi:plasmid stabilization system protein ParE
MSSYQFTPQAIEDLFEIWSYIAGDDLEAASRVEDAIRAGCAFLTDTPLAGRIREDLTSLPLRFWLVQPYRNFGLCTVQRQNRCRSFGSFTRREIFRRY